MFTSLPFPESSARREGKGGREEGQSRDAKDAGRVVHSVASREATGNRGGFVLCSVPSLLLCQSDPYCFVCVCVFLCVLVRPTYCRLLVTLLRRAHRLAGTRRARPVDVYIVPLQGVPTEICWILRNP